MNQRSVNERSECMNSLNERCERQEATASFYIFKNLHAYTLRSLANFMDDCIIVEATSELSFYYFTTIDVFVIPVIVIFVVLHPGLIARFVFSPTY